jgi:NAD(P)H-hydrate epimerase
MVAHYPTVASNEIGWLTEAQMVEVDRIMIEDIHIDLMQMMENAGRNLAQLTIDLYAPQTALVMCGSGGNGGGGLVAARHLANRGVNVAVVLAKPAEQLATVPAHQYDIVERMGVPVVDVSALTGSDPAGNPAGTDVVIDALVGYSLDGAPRGKLAMLIAAAPTLAHRIVSLDAPSGLNVSDGSTPGAVITADATLTLALPKVGLRDASQVGGLYLADISVPPSVYTSAGVGPPPSFGPTPIIRITAPTNA